MSSRPSPFTSARVTPVVQDPSLFRRPASSVTSRKRNFPSFKYSRVPPWFDVTTISGRPSPLKSPIATRSEEHTSELQSLAYLVCRLLLEKKKRQGPRIERLECQADG